MRVCRELVHLGVGPPFWRRGGHRGSAIAQFERVMVVSYRLSTVTIALSLTIRPQFAIECLWRSNQQGTGWVILGHNLESRGLTNANQMLTLVPAAVFWRRLPAAGGYFTPRHISSSRAHSNKIPTAIPMFSGSNF